MTAYDITELVVRQTIVHDRALGRVDATVRVASVAQLIATLAGRLPGARDRAAHHAVIAPVFGLLGVLILWFSPVRALAELPVAARCRRRWRPSRRSGATARSGA